MTPGFIVLALGLAFFIWMCGVDDDDDDFV